MAEDLPFPGESPRVTKSRPNEKTLSRMKSARACCWMLTDEQPVYGELTACRSALVFQPSPEHETFQLRLRLPSILGATVTPFKRRLMIQSADRPYWFSGPSVASLGQRLMSLLERRRV